MVFVRRIGLVRQYDEIRCHESRDVIDVAVRIVARAAAAEPQRLAYAEIIAEEPLVSVTIETRIANLDVRQQTLFGREKQPLTIGVDRSTLEYRGSFSIGTLSIDRRQPGEPGHGCTHLRVMVVVVVLGPGVEAPTHPRGRSVGLDDPGRCRVTKPCAIRCDQVQAVSRLGDTVGGECGERLVANARVLAQDLDTLVGRDHANDFGVDPSDGVELAGPVRLVVGPCDPRCGVRSPIRPAYDVRA